MSIARDSLAFSFSAFSFQLSAFVPWLLPTTEKFPKKVRLTLSNRIDNLALDVAMTLTEAQYTKSPANHIRQTNLLLTKLRILLRLSHALTFLPHKQYEYASRKIDEVGHMIGAWGKMGDTLGG